MSTTVDLASRDDSGLTPSSSAESASPPLYPAIVEAAERVASGAQHRYFWTTRADLLLLVAAASMVVIFVLAEDRLWDTDDGRGYIWRISMPILLAGSFAAKVLNRKRNDEGQWIQARAVAEQIKSLSWRYAIGAAPFQIETIETSASKQFAQLVDELTIDITLPPLREHVLQECLPTLPMRDLRNSDLPGRRQQYLTDRLDDQIGWYASRAERSDLATQRWYRSSVVIKAMALLAAIGAVFWLPVAVFIGFGTTLGASALAASKLGRHQEVRRRYAQAGSELNLLRSIICEAQDDAELATGVEAAEDVISREHAIWIGRL